MGPFQEMYQLDGTVGDGWRRRWRAEGGRRDMGPPKRFTN